MLLYLHAPVPTLFKTERGNLKRSKKKGELPPAFLLPVLLYFLYLLAKLSKSKPGKAPGSDSIFSELIVHAGAALKSWLRDFLSSCLY